MRILRLAIWMLSASLVIFETGLVSGQEFPNKPVRIYTGSAGGNSDFTARLVAQGLTGNLKQSVIVENRGGTIAPEFVSKAPPDGYSILLDGGSFWIAPLLENVPFDPVRDFIPITLLSQSPNVLVVHPSLPVKSVKEFIALAKSRPGELNYGTGGIGGGAHLATALFVSMADIKVAQINYRGAGPSVIGLLSGEVQVMCTNVPSVSAHLKSGRLKPLAVSTTQPTDLAPGLPTIASSGVPGYEAITILGLFVPAKTSDAVVGRLNQETVRALNSADIKQKLFANGSEPYPSTTDQAVTKVASEIAKWSKIIKAGPK